MSWISRLGFTLAVMLAVTLASIALTAKYYRAARMGDPTLARELEKELADLKQSYQTMEAKKVSVPSQPTLPLPTDSAATGAPLPIVTPTVTVTVTPQGQVPSSAASPAVTGPATLFSAFPADIKLAPEPANIPISIDELKATWRGKNLKVQFAIHYVREDKGSQQGRIIILVRGPEMIQAYPPGVFRKAGSESLLAQDQGEYFSVSRFREVKAEFGPLPSTASIQDVEIILLNSLGQVMIHQVVHPSLPATPPPTPRPVRTAKPAAEASTEPPAASPTEPAQKPAEPAQQPPEAQP